MYQSPASFRPANTLIDTNVVSIVNDAQVMSQRSRQKLKIENPFAIDVHDGSITLIPLVYEIEQYVESESILIKGICTISKVTNSRSISTS